MYQTSASIRSLISISLGLFIAGIALADVRLDFDSAHGEFGTGIRTFKGKRLSSTCVTNAREGESEDLLHLVDFEELLGAAEGKLESVEWKQIYSRDELIQNLDLSINAEMNLRSPLKDVRAEASSKTKWVDRLRFNRKYKYILAKAVYSGKTYTVSDRYLRIRSDFKQASRPLHQYMGHFLQNCGDSYLKAISTGGYFYALIEERQYSDTESQDRLNQIDLSGHYGVGLEIDLSGSLSASSLNINNKEGHQGSIHFIRLGGGGIGSILAARGVNESIEVEGSGVLEQSVSSGQMPLTLYNLNLLRDLLRNFSKYVEEDPAKVYAHYTNFDPPLLMTGIDRQVTQEGLSQVCKSDNEFMNNFLDSPIAGHDSLPVACEDVNIDQYITDTLNRFEQNNEQLETLLKKLTHLDQLDYEIKLQRKLMVNRATLLGQSPIGLELPEHIAAQEKVRQSARDLIDAVIDECFEKYAECNLKRLMDDSKMVYPFDAMAEALERSRLQEQIELKQMELKEKEERRLARESEAEVKKAFASSVDLIKSGSLPQFFKTFASEACPAHQRHPEASDFEGLNSAARLAAIGLFARHGYHHPYKAQVSLFDRRDAWNCVWTTSPCRMEGDEYLHGLRGGMGTKIFYPTGDLIGNVVRAPDREFECQSKVYFPSAYRGCLHMCLDRDR